MAAGLQLRLGITPEYVPGDLRSADHPQPCRRCIENVKRQIIRPMDQRIRRERSELAQRDGGVRKDADDTGSTGGEADEHVGAGEDALAGGGHGSRHCSGRCMEGGGVRGGGGEEWGGSEEIRSATGVQNFVVADAKRSVRYSETAFGKFRAGIRVRGWARGPLDRHKQGLAMMVMMMGGASSIATG